MEHHQPSAPPAPANDAALPQASRSQHDGGHVQKKASQPHLAVQMDANANACTHLPSPLLTPTDTESPHPDFPDTAIASDSDQQQALPAPNDGNSSEASAQAPASISRAGNHATTKRHRGSSGARSTPGDVVRRLSATKIQELAAAPESLPIETLPDAARRADGPLSAGIAESAARQYPIDSLQTALEIRSSRPDSRHLININGSSNPSARPPLSSRALSTPPTSRRKSGSQLVAQVSSQRPSHNPAPRPPPLRLDDNAFTTSSAAKPTPKTHVEPSPRPPSPMPAAIPLPPMSIPTLLQLELAGQRPSPLYIHHSHTSDLPYESSAVKFERLKHVLLIPSFLERTINFGALACLDAWLWTFTILPIRFCVALGVLLRWWLYLVAKEIRWVTAYVWQGLGRLWARGRRGRASTVDANGDGGSANASDSSRAGSRVRENLDSSAKGTATGSASVKIADGHLNRRPESMRKPSSRGSRQSQENGHSSRREAFRHRRTKSMPSNLTSFHKADLLQGAVIIFSSLVLMNFDASRMYHLIRAQSAVKLYVIYNLIEVGDRLLSALGQDIMECLFSNETLSRNASGRSKIMLPLGMFLMSLVYNVAHAVVLLYQVITLNVAVNSYSNALLSLLMSNQFVEVKSTVFKRFEKENTFQLTCADIVERFQLWIILVIIAMRNVVEVGGISIPGAGADLGMDDAPVKVPLHNSSILPASFTILPSWLASGEVLSPFLIVIGSEMIVDWIKHAYINKFNNIKPNFYSHILDILCKDYYTNAFVTPSLTRRLGLPLFPLCCLFIRSAVQTYHMFLATYLPVPVPPSTQTSLTVDAATPSSQAVAATLDRLDILIRNALGRAVYGYPHDTTGSVPLTRFGPWTSDDIIATITMIVVFFIAFLVLLIVKLLLGMALLRYSRNRYAKMKAKEHAVATGKAERETYDGESKRLGGFGKVEVGEERRRWLFEDDPAGLQKAREKESRDAAKARKELDLGNVMRYEMVAKRIW